MPVLSLGLPLPFGKNLTVIGYTVGYIILTDGIDIFRKGIRDDSFMLDKAITPTGFSGTEDVDWVNIWEIEYTSPVVDYDGNEYNTVIIGDQEWIVQNLRTTHYADGTAIEDPDPWSGTDIVTSWTNSIYENNDFETLTTNGADITSAINSSGAGTMTSNLITATTEDLIFVEFTLTLTSGALPQTLQYNNGFGQIVSLSSATTAPTIVEGLNRYCFYPRGDAAGTGFFQLSVGGLATEFSVTPFNARIINPGFCYYDDNNTYAPSYGALYNLPAVLDSRELVYFTRDGVEESGWRVPTVTDIETLSDYLGGDLISAGKLKAAGLTFWDTPNTGATDEVGFRGVGSGDRYALAGYFAQMGTRGYYWTSEEYYNQEYNRTGGSYGLQNDDVEIIISPSDWPINGYAVRCVRDI